ncbi:MAG: EAL domain-containing protein [Campylobacterota bacterium]|nr:EAL domain-containing protein [Campylobacterota bacterium]
MKTTLYFFDTKWSAPFDQSLDSEQTLVLVFGSPDTSKIDKPLSQLLKAFPNSITIGCSSAGEISMDNVRYNSLSVQVIRFKTTLLRQTSIRFKDHKNVEAAGIALAEDLTGENLQGLFLLSDGLDINGSKLIKGINSILDPSVTITGGMAGDNANFETSWVISNNAIGVEKVAAVGFYGSSVKFYHSFKDGWEKLGIEWKVTRSAGNILYALDNQPALSLYKRYLGDNASSLPSSGLLFPLAVLDDKGEKIYVRTVLDVDEAQQSITFAGDIPEGSMVSLMTAGRNDLIEGAEDAAKQLMDLAPDPTLPSACIVISSVGRQMVLKQTVEEELEAVLDLMPKKTLMSGFYSNGEISPLPSGRANLHNQTMALTLIQEQSDLHRLLRRQLRRLQIDPQYPEIDNETSQGLFELVSQSYREDNEQIKLLQQSLKISSDEMRSCHKEFEQPSENHMHTIVKAIPDQMLLFNDKGVCLDVLVDGQAVGKLDSKDQIIDKSTFEIFPEKQANAFYALIESALNSGKIQTMQYTMDTPVGGHQYFEARAVPTDALINERKTTIVMIRDTTDLRQLEHSSHLLSAVFDEATEGMLIKNANREAIFVNPAMLNILGISEDECLGKHTSYFSGMIPEEDRKKIDASMPVSGHWHGETTLTRPDGKELFVWLTLDALQDKSGTLTNIVIMVTDISELRQSRENLQFMATHDTLTSVPNRALLLDRISHSIEIIKRERKMGALFFLDLDNFKKINDELGHQVGDRVLQETAKRLVDTVRASDTVGRLGGDEFLLITENINHVDEIIVIAQKILKAFSTPLNIKGRDIEITLSMGIALIPTDGEDTETLISAADRALYLAKERGRNGFAFYSKEHASHSHDYANIQRIVRKAVKDEDFNIVYQPQYSLEDGNLTGVEALLRFMDPDIKDIPIDQIISIAEESDLIYEITKVVLKRVCDQIMQWQTLLSNPITIAVNLSQQELGSKDLVSILQKYISRYRIDPAWLEFEITENTLVQSGSIAKQNIDAVRKLGCCFSIDDFGTGYSSLSNLQKSDLDKLKIDRTFIEALENDKNGRILVEATISMAKKLGLRVLAEGVETKAQADVLRSYGCDEVQGFFFGKPVTAEAFTELLR